MTAVGITGTRNGASEEQLLELRRHLTILSLRDESAGTRARLHHGDCVGVDQQAHEIALELDMAIEVHPPAKSKYRAYTTGWEVLHKEQDFVIRNRQIVEACDLLIAVPQRAHSMSARSGTWMTIRIARTLGKPVLIVRAGRW